MLLARRDFLFDAAYTRALVDIGHRDAGDRIDEVEAFLREGRPARARVRTRSAADRNLDATPQTG